MKKIITTALLLLSLTGCQTVGIDKYMHAGGSALMAVSFSIPLQQSNVKEHSNELAFAACMTVGLAKEVYDEVSRGGFSGEDLVADGVGCAIGVVISHVINGK